MSKLAALGAKLFHPQQEFRPKIITTSKRVRGKLDGEYIFDTTEAKLVWENKFFPAYWIPQRDFLPIAQITPDRAISGIQQSTSRLEVGTKAITTLLVPDSFNSELAGYVKIEPDDLDIWFEENEPVLSHPKDPYHRVDVITSDRNVRIEIEGTVIADSGKGEIMTLWETGFPGRFYLPRSMVKTEYLRPSEKHTVCPYKGQASYHDIEVNGKTYKDAVWYYDNPTYESGRVKSLLCFYPDKVDTFVDGKAIEKVGMPTMDEKHEFVHGKGCNC